MSEPTNPLRRPKMNHGDADRINSVMDELGLGEEHPGQYPHRSLLHEWEQNSMDEQFGQIVEGQEP